MKYFISFFAVATGFVLGNMLFRNLFICVSIICRGYSLFLKVFRNFSTLDNLLYETKGDMRGVATFL